VAQDPTIERARSEGRIFLNEVESKEIIKKAGIEVIATRLARSKEEAISLSYELGFPVALKITSPDIIHKSDIGGVRLGLKTAKQVARAYDEILTSARKAYPKAIIHGISVQKMARPGIEVIVGLSKDAQFGPLVMFGLGGILVEILKDVSFRIVPLSHRDAQEMIREIKGYPLLLGYRGQEPADLSALEDLLLKVSDLAQRIPEIKELDLNPVFAYNDSAVVVDARILLEEAR